MFVGRGVEVSLEWPDSPLATPREREREDSSSASIKSVPSNRGCCFILRQTLKASRFGNWGNDAVVDHRTNSETGTNSGLLSTSSRKWVSELAGPGEMATCGSSGSPSKPPPRLVSEAELADGNERDRVATVDPVECPLLGVEAGDNREYRVTDTRATV